jgi:hypothetical protein
LHATIRLMGSFKAQRCDHLRLDINYNAEQNKILILLRVFQHEVYGFKIKRIHDFLNIIRKSGIMTHHRIPDREYMEIGVHGPEGCGHYTAHRTQPAQKKSIAIFPAQDLFKTGFFEGCKI